MPAPGCETPALIEGSFARQGLNLSFVRPLGLPEGGLAATRERSRQRFECPRNSTSRRCSRCSRTPAQATHRIVNMVLSSIADGVTIANASGSALYFNVAGRKIMGMPQDFSGDVYTHGADLCYFLHDFHPMPADRYPSFALYAARTPRASSSSCAALAFPRGRSSFSIRGRFARRMVGSSGASLCFTTTARESARRTSFRSCQRQARRMGGRAGASRTRC